MLQKCFSWWKHLFRADTTNGYKFFGNDERKKNVLRVSKRQFNFILLFSFEGSKKMVSELMTKVSISLQKLCDKKCVASEVTIRAPET